MNLKKRMIALVLSVAMVLTYMPAVVFAEGSADYGYAPSAEETAAKEERDAAQAKYDAAKAAHDAASADLEASLFSAGAGDKGVFHVIIVLEEGIHKIVGVIVP